MYIHKLSSMLLVVCSMAVLLVPSVTSTDQLRHNGNGQYKGSRAPTWVAIGGGPCPAPPFPPSPLRAYA